MVYAATKKTLMSMIPEVACIWFFGGVRIKQLSMGQWPSKRSKPKLIASAIEMDTITTLTGNPIKATW